ncbi:MAG: hypothetical protein ACXQTG_00455 [Methanoculleaceae archaeon]
MKKSRAILFTAGGTILDTNRASLEIPGLERIQELVKGSIFDICCNKGLIRRGEILETELVCDFDRLKRDRQILIPRSGIVYTGVVFTPITPDGGCPDRVRQTLFGYHDRAAGEEGTGLQGDALPVVPREYLQRYGPIDGGNGYIIKDVNRVTAALLRMNREDLVGKKLFVEFPGPPDPFVRDLLYRVLTTEKPESVKPLKYRNREDFCWISHYVFKLPSGEIASFMIDVSDTVHGGAEAPIRACGARKTRENGLSGIGI